MARVSAALATELEMESFRKIMGIVDTHTDTVQSVVYEIVNEYTKDIDKLIDDIQAKLNSQEFLDPYDMDRYEVQIPLCLYYLSEGLSYIDTMKDVSKAIRQVAFNEARARATGTVADKDAIAEQAVEQETLASITFDKAYKLLTHKKEIALELLTALKKVTSRRIAEYDMSRYNSNDSST